MLIFMKKVKLIIQRKTDYQVGHIEYNNLLSDVREIKPIIALEKLQIWDT